MAIRSKRWNIERNTMMMFRQSITHGRLAGVTLKTVEHFVLFYFKYLNGLAK